MTRRDLCVEKIPGRGGLALSWAVWLTFTKITGSFILPVTRRQVSWALQSAWDTPERAGCLEHVLEPGMLEPGMLDPAGTAPHAGRAAPVLAEYSPQSPTTARDPEKP